MMNKGRLTECQFLQCAASSLGVHEVDERELEDEPCCDDGHVFPANGGDSNGVDILREETADLAPDLLDGDTAGSLGVGKEFGEVGWIALA